MSHVSPSHTAHATDHAVRRYAERILGLDLGGEAVPDPEALTRARTRGIDCAGIRARLAALGGILIAAGMDTGAVVVPGDRMTVRMTGGAVVTVLTPPVRRPQKRTWRRVGSLSL